MSKGLSENILINKNLVDKTNKKTPVDNIILINTHAPIFTHSPILHAVSIYRFINYLEQLSLLYSAKSVV